MSAQAVIMRKTLFGVDVDGSIVASYQTEAAGLSVDSTTYTDGASNYQFDNTASFVGQFNGVTSFCTSTNDATLVSFIQTLRTNNPSITIVTFSQDASYGI